MSKTLDKTLNFAIVGCGVIGPTHARSISHIPGAKLVAVCDIVEEKARRLAENFGIAAYTDYNEMLEREDIDVVNVTTPSGLHAQVGMAAALAGKHVIVEKPIDVTLEKADALIRTCQSAGVKLSTISQHRFDQAIIDLKRAIAENKLGKLNFGGAHTKWYRGQEYYDGDAWRGTWALDGGGALMNQGIHYVDMLQYCMGPVAEVYAYAATRTHVRIEAEDIVVASVRFKSGALGFIEGNTAAFPGFCARLDIYGDDGGVVIEDDRVKDWKLRSCETYQVTAEAGTPISGTSSAYIWEEAHRRQIEDVANAIRTGQPVFIPGEEGRKPLEIILAIYESARTGKPVMIP
jgi:UDP-N-acetyl-2-amino-2-deoxyglucuronate dehydrogenase